MKLLTAIVTGLVLFGGNVLAVEGYKEFKFGDSYGETVSNARNFCPIGVDLGFGPHSYFQSYPYVCAPGIKMGGVDRNIFFFFESPPTPGDDPGKLLGVIIDIGPYTQKLHNGGSVWEAWKGTGQKRLPGLQPQADFVFANPFRQSHRLPAADLVQHRDSDSGCLSSKENQRENFQR